MLGVLPQKRYVMYSIMIHDPSTITVTQRHKPGATKEREGRELKGVISRR